MENKFQKLCVNKKFFQILSFRVWGVGSNIANYRQYWHQQPILQINALVHSPQCNTCSSAEMLCQSHWKTQIKGLTKQQFVLVSVHSARVCRAEKGGTRARVPPLFFIHWAVNFVPCPQEQRIRPSGPLPHQTSFPKGSMRSGGVSAALARWRC
jgi:hypothetical protein